MSNNDGYHKHGHHGRSRDRHHKHHNQHYQYQHQNIQPMGPAYEHVQGISPFQIPPFLPTNRLPPPPPVHGYPPMYNQQAHPVPSPQMMMHSMNQLPNQSMYPPNLRMDHNVFHDPLQYQGPAHGMLPPDPMGLLLPPSIAMTQKPIESILSNSALSNLRIPSSQITDKGIIPNNPYYELPAGLMAPLVEPSRKEYKPLEPTDLRLPLPKFPDEEFLKTIDAYYGNDGRARDNDGWDREFIDMYIGQKQALSGQ